MLCYSKELLENKKALPNKFRQGYGCRGRLRTSTEKLAARHKKNILVVNPLPCVYPFLSTPETGGLVCQFQHPTILKNYLFF
jgi:hypothetical protein